MDLNLENCPPMVEEVANFEHDLMMMIKNIQLTNINNDFLTKLRNDIFDIQKCEEVFIQADKSNQLYFRKKKYREHLGSFFADTVTERQFLVK